MNTFQLRCFLTLAQTLNFARAAQQLSVTQPAVSHQIRTLEEELNVKLFKRTTRSVELTRSGKLFINDAKEILAVYGRAKNRFENPSQQEIQVFSVGSYSYSQLFSLPGILDRIRRLHPHIHPRLEVMAFQHLYRALEEENLDVILAFREPEERKTPGIYRELQRVPMVCVCAPEHPFVKKGQVEVEELRGERLVVHDPVITPVAVTQLQGRLLGGRAPSDFYFSASPEASMVLAQAGYGVALLPEILVRDNPFLGKVALRDTPLLSFGVYYKSLQGNEILKSFIRLLREETSARQREGSGAENS